MKTEGKNLLASLHSDVAYWWWLNTGNKSIPFDIALLELTALPVDESNCIYFGALLELTETRTRDGPRAESENLLARSQVDSDIESKQEPRGGRSDWFQWCGRHFQSKATCGSGLIAGTIQSIANHDWDRRQLQLFNTTLNSVANPVMFPNARDVFKWTNPGVTPSSGYSAREAAVANASILTSGLHGQECYRDLWDVICAEIQ